MVNKETPSVPEIVVGVLICNDKDKIFLARSYKWKDKWVVPGGHLKLGETLHQCVKREVKEETDLDVGNIELIGIQESIFSKEFHKKRHMVFMDFSAEARSDHVSLNEELQEYKWFNPKDALKMNLNSSTRRFIKRFIEKSACSRDLSCIY